MAAKKTVETVAIKMPVRTRVKIRIIGDTPLIVHAWDPKAKRMMLEEQQKKKGTKKEHMERLPFDDFARSLYWLTPMPTTEYKDKLTGKNREIVTEELFDKAIEDGARFGFPANSFKKAANSGAYRKGWVPDKVTANGAYFIWAEDGGEFVEIKGSIPALREDTVKLQGKTTDLRYRAIFDPWYCDMILDYDENGQFNLDELLSFVQAGGYSVGVGEWRPERSGYFGMFHVETI